MPRPSQSVIAKNPKQYRNRVLDFLDTPTYRLDRRQVRTLPKLAGVGGKSPKGVPYGKLRAAVSRRPVADF